MRAQQPLATAEVRAPRRVRSWRLLLLILLVLLPVTLALASPEPVQFTPVDTSEHESGVYAHSPLDTPVCHHDWHHENAPALVSNNREAELPAPADNVAAIPSQGPAHDRLPVPGTAPHGSLSDDVLPAVPVYLLTQRLRV